VLRKVKILEISTVIKSSRKIFIVKVPTQIKLGQVFDVTNERWDETRYVLSYADSSDGICSICYLGPGARVGRLVPVADGWWIGPESFEVEKNGLIILVGVRS
nr:hypothetical protein [Tanacetum cinerariifolium]